MKKRFFPVAAAVAALALAGCAGAGSQSDQSGNAAGVKVAASFYPLAYLAEEIGGDAVTVTDLTPPGGDAHELEISPKQVSELGKQDLVLYLGSGFQPAVEEAVAMQDAPALDAMDAVKEDQLREGDAHIWLNPMIMAEIGDLTAERLSETDPNHAETFAHNAKEFRTKMEALDSKYREELAGCAGATLVTSHEAFGYLADAYSLEQIGITGINPEAEPSPKRLREVEKIAKEHDATTIFFESTAAQTTADRLAEAVGVKTAQLNPIEGTPEQDFVTVMETNLSALSGGLNCK